MYNPALSIITTVWKEDKTGQARTSGLAEDYLKEHGTKKQNIWEKY